MKYVVTLVACVAVSATLAVAYAAFPRTEQVTVRLPSIRLSRRSRLRCPTSRRSTAPSRWSTANRSAASGPTRRSRRRRQARPGGWSGAGGRRSATSRASSSGSRASRDWRYSEAVTPTVAAGGRLCRPGGQLGVAAEVPEGGGSWGNQGFPHVEEGGPKAALSFTPGGRSDQWPVATFVVTPARAAASSRNLPPSTASARISRPVPVRSSAIPTTIPKTESCSAM